ncbi:hypothetical protein RTE01_23720 [Raoultella terrigena]|nr:hypothetical protein RTE01_23720 [Raoultella terrigena]
MVDGDFFTLHINDFDFAGGADGLRLPGGGRGGHHFAMLVSGGLGAGDRCGQKKTKNDRFCDMIHD